jgi:hypothetical protein
VTARLAMAQREETGIGCAKRNSILNRKWRLVLIIFISPSMDLRKIVLGTRALFILCV